MTTCLSSNEPTAKKEHICDWCSEPILRGEKYYRQSLVYDGEFQMNLWHLECKPAAIKFCQENMGEYTPRDKGNKRPVKSEQPQP